jgi:DNA-binding CsgD family transcriptional regulator/PAS domain-containing protein
MPSLNEKDLFDLTAEMYECAAGAHDIGWLSIYERLAKLMSSGPGSLHFLDKTAQRFEAFADTNEPGFIDRFNEEYFRIYPARKKILNLATGQDFIRMRDCPDQIYKSSEVYREYLRHHEIDYVFHRCLYESRSTSIGVTFTRPWQMRRFDDAEIEVFDEVSAHLKRAIGLFVKVREAAAGNRMAIAAWDNLPHGAVILSLSGEVVFANLAAAKLFESGEFRIGRDRVFSLNNDHADRKLRAILNGMLRHNAEIQGSFGGTIFSARADRPSLTISISPFQESGAVGIIKRYALLLISDPSSGGPSSEAFLREKYRLTSAETGLALLLAKGHSLKETAELLGITLNTARTHLKRIFGKTAVNRQSSLVRLILSQDSRQHDR